MSSIHEYPVTVRWEGGRNGSGTVQSGRFDSNFKISVPPEFQGPGEGTNPEELLCSAIAACYTITFGIIAANRKLPVKDVVTDAVGTVVQNGAQFTYTTVTIKPVISIDASATDDQMKIAEEMAHKADLYCIITNAVRDKVEIKVEPTLQRA